MSMFLARITGSGKPQVYPLLGALYFPKAWIFISYTRGASAIGFTQVEAITAARRELARPLRVRVVTVQERRSNERDLVAYVQERMAQQQSEFLSLLK